MGTVLVWNGGGGVRWRPQHRGRKGGAWAARDGQGVPVCPGSDSLAAQAGTGLVRPGTGSTREVGGAGGVAAGGSQGPCRSVLQPAPG